jgi:hypothetical protein
LFQQQSGFQHARAVLRGKPLALSKGRICPVKKTVYIFVHETINVRLFAAGGLSVWRRAAAYFGAGPGRSGEIGSSAEEEAHFRVGTRLALAD